MSLLKNGTLNPAFHSVVPPLPDCLFLGPAPEQGFGISRHLKARHEITVAMGTTNMWCRVDRGIHCQQGGHASAFTAFQELPYQVLVNSRAWLKNQEVRGRMDIL